MTRAFRVSSLALVVLGIAGAARADDSRKVTIQGGEVDLGETPIVVVLKEKLPEGTYTLTPSGGGDSLLTDVHHDAGQTMLSVVLPKVEARTTRTYTLTKASDSVPPALTISAGSGAGALEIRVDAKPFLTYLPEAGPKPYFFPVIGPTGERFTRAYPMERVAGEDQDHPHQRSFWFTHGKVNRIDFWSEEKGHGAIRETSRKTIRSGNAVAILRTTDEWLGPDGQKVCEDERILRVFRTRTARILDFGVTIQATNGPVTFGDTKEGMFGLRVASSMDVKNKKGGKITNAEGLTDLAAWGKASPWVDYTGPVGGKTVGVAILNHPESFRYPTTWHVRDYGLFAANPFGWHDFGRKESGDHTIRAGEMLRFRYRVILHDGDTATANLPAAFRAYAEPPGVTVEAP